MLDISGKISIPDHEIEITAIRAQGAGGQNVNKVASAVHLRFDIARSSLPDAFKARLMALRDHRVTRDGVVIIKAQRYRSQEDNRADALRRLSALIRAAAVVPAVRRATRPSLAAKRRRLDGKTRRGEIKAMRGKIGPGRPEQ